jgi:hypothetical protein
MQERPKLALLNDAYHGWPAGHDGRAAGMAVQCRHLADRVTADPDREQRLTPVGSGAGHLRDGMDE